MLLTKNIFEKALHKIGWSLRDVGCGCNVLLDNKGNDTQFQLWHDRGIEINYKGQQQGISRTIANTLFYFKDCRFEFKRTPGFRNTINKTLCLYAKGNKNVFILFFNFD